MTDNELSDLLRQLETEFKAKYTYIDVNLKKLKKSKIYGVSVTIKYKTERTYYTCTFTENASVTTLRRHLYNIVNKKGEEYARREKRISAKRQASI